MMQITKGIIKEFAEKYDLRFKDTKIETIENEIEKWLREHRYLDKENLMKIGHWKSPRPKKHYANNDDFFVKEITQFSFVTNSEEARLESLLVLKGVSYPLASVILHFAFPNKYPILDFRAIWSLGWDMPKYNETFNFWQKYCAEIKKISEQTGCNFRRIDKALWEYSKQNQKRK